MEQSRIESLIESLLNTFSGYLISYLAWVLIVGPLLGLGAGTGFWVTNFFTVLSVVRSYAWRRFFNGYMYRRVHEWVKKFV